MTKRSQIDDPNTDVAARVLENADYQFLCQLIYERSRIHLGPDKRVLVTSRLAGACGINLDNYRD